MTNNPQRLMTKKQLCPHTYGSMWIYISQPVHGQGRRRSTVQTQDTLMTSLTMEIAFSCNAHTERLWTSQGWTSTSVTLGIQGALSVEDDSAAELRVRLKYGGMYTSIPLAEETFVISDATETLQHQSPTTTTWPKNSPNKELLTHGVSSSEIGSKQNAEFSTLLSHYMYVCN